MAGAETVRRRRRRAGTSRFRRQADSVEETPLIVPEYASRFRCIGPECEDTCCRGWGVAVDRQSYEKYEVLPDGPLRSLVRRSLVRISDAAHGDLQFAAVRLGPSRVCPFLTEEKLCRIQVEHGESYLTRVCAAFPRFVYTVDGIEQKPLMLACPEAARLVLLSRNLLRRVKQDRRIRWDDEKTTRRPVQDYFWPIRAFSVRLVRNRRYALWQRLCLLEIFCRRLDALARGEDQRRFSELLEDFCGVVESGKLCGPMEQVPDHPEIQLELVMRLVRLRVDEGAEDPRLRETLAMCDAGLAADGERCGQEPVDRYTSARRGIYAPFFRRRPHILENYLINEMFRWAFPFGEALFDRAVPVQCHRAFGRLAIQFGLLQGVLTGVSAARGAAFREADVVRTVQVISKQFEHHRHFADAGHALLATRGLDTLAGYTVLLRT